MNLYIVRHGQTDGNVYKIMDGIRDIDFEHALCLSCFCVQIYGIFRLVKSFYSFFYKNDFNRCFLQIDYPQKALNHLIVG